MASIFYVKDEARSYADVSFGEKKEGLKRILSVAAFLSEMSKRTKSE